MIPDKPKQQTSTRFASLDAFRGLTIMLMILVNNPGSWSHIYAPLKHAPWDGCTLTDLVFPFFMFIVGSAMYFSFSKSDLRFGSRLALKIVKRTLIIFAIGLALHAMAAYTWKSDFRIPGVLQRIALAYCGAAFIVLFTRGQVINLSVASGLILGYWVLLIVFGSDTPYSLEGNAVRKLDLLVFGPQRMYSVNEIAFDPEGLLSTIPSIASIIIGFEVTRVLESGTSKFRSTMVLSAIGAILILVGWSWGHIWPVNKALWTGPFVLFTSGWAMIVLSVLIVLMDVVGLRFSMLQAYGMNPLFLYVFSWIWMLSYWLIPFGEGKLFTVIFDVFLAGDEITKASSFLFAASHVLLFGAFAMILYRNKIVIKV